MCYLLPPLILDEIEKSHHICIVISPLKSLMLDQCKHNDSHGISAAVIQGRDDMSMEVIEGMHFCLHMLTVHDYFSLTLNK